MGRGSWWYSGEIDLGYSGALRSAATIVVDDPIFGLFAYGGELSREKNLTQVIPKDGLRTRFHIVRGAQRVHILLDRDGFAKDKPVSFDDALTTIRLTLENRASASHDTIVRIVGLPAGNYEAAAQNHPPQKLDGSKGEEQQIRIPARRLKCLRCHHPSQCLDAPLSQQISRHGKSPRLPAVSYMSDKPNGKRGNLQEESKMQAIAENA